MSFHLRKSRVLKTMREGRVATCTKLNLSDPRAVEIAAMSDFDCLWLDMEHVPNNIESIENCVRAAKIYDKDILTRVSKGCYSDLVRPFEGDSTGIMVPHLMSYEEAKQIVYYTKFSPVGRRPLDGGNADGAYCLVNGADYMAEANAERFNVVQIEDPEPMAELEKICKLEGIDMIFFGPADFSQGIGKPLKFDDPELIKAKQMVAECARKNGKWAGTTGGAGNFDSLVDMGYSFISVGADVCGLSGYYKNLTAAVSGRKIKEV